MVFQPSGTTLDRFNRRAALIQRCLRENKIIYDGCDPENEEKCENNGKSCRIVISPTGSLTLGIY